MEELKTRILAYVIPLVGYGAITGILNLLVAERSRVDAWAESRPKLAALLKLLRAAGFDPWNAVAAASLWTKGRLPAAQRPPETRE